MFKVQKVAEFIAKHFIFKILMFTKLIRMKCNAVNRIQIHTFFFTLSHLLTQQTCCFKAFFENII